MFFLHQRPCFRGDVGEDLRTDTKRFSLFVSRHPLGFLSQ